MSSVCESIGFSVRVAFFTGGALPAFGSYSKSMPSMPWVQTLQKSSVDDQLQDFASGKKPAMADKV
jgi:hypothetical protein